VTIPIASFMQPAQTPRKLLGILKGQGFRAARRLIGLHRVPDPPNQAIRAAGHARTLSFHDRRTLRSGDSFRFRESQCRWLVLTIVYHRRSGSSKGIGKAPTAPGRLAIPGRGHPGTAPRPLGFRRTPYSCPLDPLVFHSPRRPFLPVERGYGGSVRTLILPARQVPAAFARRWVDALSALAIGANFHRTNRSPTSAPTPPASKSARDLFVPRG